jgi:concanavalin A-like lectin/glucanase superfamily protein
MLVWNYNVQFELVLGFGVKDVTLEYSEDGVDWSVLGDVELAKATATADYVANTTVDLQGVRAKFLRLNVNSGWGPMGQFGLSEVRISQVPVFAREPQPADGAVGVDPETRLSWRGGREAAAHEVYFSTEEAAVVDGTALVDTVDATTLSPGSLNLGTTYYWKISEVNETEAISVWPGDVWSFATLEYFVVDDFESYDDEENTIFDAWLDGFVNDTGSTVGYFDAPFAEKTIVHGGGQSMPLAYANDVAPFYSEAECDLGSVDWTVNGADTLKLYVSGRAPAFSETADGRILMNGIGADIWGSADQFRYAYKSLTGDGSITARVDALDGSPSSWAKGGVMIRQGTGIGAVNVFMAMTGGDGGGATFQQRMVQDDASVSQHTYADAPFAPPYWVRVTREGDTLMGLTSPDGENWTQRGDPVTLAMNDPVLIGLALTSHNVDQATSAEFSNVSVTGSVSAGWQMEEVGVAQPEGNVLDNLYVAVEDTSGNVVVVDHPDAGAVGRSGWNAWAIPFDDLAGVNLSRVATMYIGVGDRDDPSAGGAGLIFIDDILVGHPRTFGPGDLAPIGSWSFDEGSGDVATDGSGNGLDGAISGAAWVSPGSNGEGSCLDFDGQGPNMVDLGNFDVTSGDGLTIALWCKADNLDTPGNDPRLFSKAIGGANEDHWFMISSSRIDNVKVFRFRLKTDGATSELKADINTGQIDLDVWTHVAAVWDGATMKLYKNGMVIGSLDKGGTLSASPDANVAIGNQPVGTDARPWDGLIDDVQLFNRGLSVDEIQVLMGQ